MRYSIDGYNYLFRRFHRNRRLQKQLKTYREKLTEYLKEESIETLNDKNKVIDLNEIKNIIDRNDSKESNENEHYIIDIKEPTELNENEHYIIDRNDSKDNIVETIDGKLNDLKNQLEDLEPYLQEKYINELQNELKDLKKYVELKKNEIENEYKEEPILYQKVVNSIRNQIPIEEPTEECMEEDIEECISNPKVLLHEEKKKNKKKNFKNY